jgi:hypothetical protein
MNRVQVPLVAAMLSAAVISLVGCGGGGGGSAVAQDQPVVNNVTVSPSLGKFSAGAHVTIKNAAGTSVGTANTTDAGTATVNIGSHTGAVVIEVTGDTNVTYYDEGSKRSQPFGAAAVLRAIAPSAATAVGVTAATNASVESIKSNNGGAIPTAITSDAINTSNNKIAVALGIADVLQAPKLVDANTLASAPLDIGSAADKYALQLAALAKLATDSTKSALDVANEIAKDLSDGKLDGQVNGAAIPNRATTYTQSTVVAAIAANVVSAANDLGTTNTQNVVTSDPTVVGSVTTDVTKIVASSPAVVLAKNLFSELRTTLSSFANNSKTGFLNNQAARIDADMKATVAPESAKLFNRLDAVGAAISVYDASQSGTAPGTVGFPGETVAPAWVRISGNFNNVLARVGGFEYCYTPSASASVTCFHAGSDSADYSTTPTKIKFVKYVLTPTGNNNFTYTAVRENRTWINNALSTTGTAPTSPSVPSGSGTITRTYASGSLIGFNLTGSLPPSAASAPGTVATGVDTIALSASKTALPAANNFRYALNGSVKTISNASPARTVTFSFDNGSYADVDETNISTTGTQPVGFNLVGTANTDATKLTGSLSMSGFTKDKSGTNTIANNVVFNGVLSDTSVGGAGDMLSGKLEATITGYQNYDITQLTAGSNYIQGTAKFTGTIQAPSRPLMKLVISGTDTGPHAGSATVIYTYGTINITASGTSSSAGSSVTVTNQDGIQIANDPSVANQQLITKNGTTVGTFKNGVINYVDGSSETLN